MSAKARIDQRSRQGSEGLTTHRSFLYKKEAFWAKIWPMPMQKKTGMSDSSLWIIAIVLFAIAALTYFKK